MTKLYTVYECGKRACGIETSGPVRSVIQTMDGSRGPAFTISIDKLGALLAALHKDGYVIKHPVAFYGERKGFQLQHPDFDSVDGRYAIYCVTPDIAQAVRELEAFGSKVIQPTQRKAFMDWLRAQDMNDDFVVAPSANPVFAFFLAHVASSNGWRMHAASVGMPAVAPAVNAKAWIDWLSIGKDDAPKLLASLTGAASAGVGSAPSASTDIADHLF